MRIKAEKFKRQIDGDKIIRHIHHDTKNVKREIKSHISKQILLSFQMLMDGKHIVTPRSNLILKKCNIAESIFCKFSENF